MMNKYVLIALSVFLLAFLVFLAKQRQDILLNSKIHPRKKMNTLSEHQQRKVFDSVKTTLAAMTDSGGRDTERDLFGNQGGYRTKLSKNNTTMLCPDCGGIV